MLGQVAGGLTGGQIAQQLVVSPETIKSHVQNAMTKLGAHTRAHAVAIALRTGQIDSVTAAAAPGPAGRRPLPPRAVRAEPRARHSRELRARQAGAAALLTRLAG